MEDLTHNYVVLPSPHYVLTVSTISGPWHPRPSPNFSPQLRDTIWEWPGDEAIERSLTHTWFY